MAFTVGTGDVVAFVAFCLALYSTIKTLKFNTRQQKLIDTQNELSKFKKRCSAIEIASLRSQ